MARTTSTPLRVGLRSLILPGWGQLSTHHPVIGWALIVISLALAATAVAAVLHLGIVELLAWTARPDVLLALLVLNLVVGAVRVVISAHAWRSGGGRGWTAVTFLTVLVLVPHLLVGWVGWTARHTLLEVFAPAPASPVPVPAVDSTTTTTPASTAASSTHGTTTTSLSTTTSTTTPTTTLPVQETGPTTTTATSVPPTPPTTTTTTTTLPFQGERLDLLVLGGDAGPGRWGLRTDTMMIASVDPSTGDAALFGLPRNFGGFTFSDGSPFPGSILNEVYSFGRSHPERFQGVDPGAVAVTDVAEHLTGLEIDHFLLVDMTGFGEVIDVFGGVTIRVPEPIDGPLYDPGTGEYQMIRIEAGEQSLDGARALAYARSRLGSSDYARMRRQRCLLTAMVADADPVDLLANLPALLGTMETHLTTDLPQDVVPELIRLTAKVAAPEVRVVGFGPEWATGITPGGYPVPDVDRIREAVHTAVTEPSAAAELGIPLAGESCG